VIVFLRFSPLLIDPHSFDFYVFIPELAPPWYPRDYLIPPCRGWLTLFVFMVLTEFVNDKIEGSSGYQFKRQYVDNNDEDTIRKERRITTEFHLFSKTHASIPTNPICLSLVIWFSYQSYTFAINPPEVFTDHYPNLHLSHKIPS
jgi:hypothetical protein